MVACHQSHLLLYSKKSSPLSIQTVKHSQVVDSVNSVENLFVWNIIKDEIVFESLKQIMMLKNKYERNIVSL